MLCRDWLGRVDEDGWFERGRFRRAVHETLRVACVRRLKDAATRLPALINSTAVNVLGRQQSDSRVAMLRVVPCKESTAVCTSLFDVLKSTRIGRAVLQRLIVRLDEWVVVRYVRSRSALHDAEICEELR